ncbi:MAG: BrnT family toxin [Caldilineales bacterium]|nr:BrnT family toxin [Caldilineales bacterium]MCW5860544.1 BrnT family toxin [Caldilineales bacterium]
MEFEWNPQKAARNLQKHKIAFVEAATVFSDPLSVTAPDPDHSLNEDRFIIVGQTHKNRLVMVSFVERRNRIRIISARELTHSERNAYEEEL